MNWLSASLEKRETGSGARKTLGRYALAVGIALMALPMTLLNVDSAQAGPSLSDQEMEDAGYGEFLSLFE